jgi:hypothetical protein
MDSVSGTILYDTSLYNRHGTINGSPTTVSGITGNALYFRGESYQDGVTLLSNSDASIYEDLMSVSVWFKSATTSGNSGGRIIGRDCSDYWCIYVDQSSAFPQDLGFYCAPSTSTTVSSSIEEDTWHHVVAYWDVANTLSKLYLDNVEVYSNSSLPAFLTSSRPIVIGCNTEEAINPTLSQFEGPIDDIRLYSRILPEFDIEALYNHGINDTSVFYLANDDLVFDVEALASGTSSNYLFRITRSDTDINFYYKTLVSGEPAPSWTSFNSVTAYDTNCTISLGLYTKNVTMSGSYFDDLIYNSGSITYPSPAGDYYGTINMDNIRIDASTVIPIYDISIIGDTMYRLQDEGTYYGTDNDWGSLYNYQVTPIRSFIDFITVAAYPEILPATGRNVSQVTAVVLNQYGEGAVYKPVHFTDDDSVGFITIPDVYTDYFTNTGEAKTSYMSGVALRIVTVQGTATQYD